MVERHVAAALKLRKLTGGPWATSSDGDVRRLAADESVTALVVTCVDALRSRVADLLSAPLGLITISTLHLNSTTDLAIEARIAVTSCQTEGVTYLATLTANRPLLVSSFGACLDPDALVSARKRV